jgi:hypothetical protein
MPALAVRQPVVALGALGLFLTAAAFVAPRVWPSDDPGDLVTRMTARVALLFWFLASAALIRRQRDFARAAWTVGCTTFLIHIATAFDRVHGWSHAAAVRHVEAVSGFGPGLFVSYLFTALWVADTLWWWLDRRGHDGRAVRLDQAIHAFFAFMVFNGTVVYETGFIRWTGVVAFALLGCLLATRLVGIEAAS